MALLNSSLRIELRNVLVRLPHPVTLLVFVRAACESCGETRGARGGIGVDFRRPR